MEARSFPEFSDEQVAAASLAAQQTTPCTLSITDCPDKIYLAFIGCHGSGNKDQEAVARLMNELGEKYPFTFKIFGGDNFYPHGAKSPVDDCFNSLRNYDTPELENICNVPGFAALGNHCGGRDTASICKSWLTETIAGISYFISTNSQKNAAAEQQQIAHSMLISDPAIFAGDAETPRKVSYKKLSGFVMPHDFYKFEPDDPDAKVSFVVLNSNTYAKDFLDLLFAKTVGKKKQQNDRVSTESSEELDDFYEPVTPDPNNQAVWYQQQAELAKAKGITIFTMQHHPHVIRDKRGYAFGYDAWHYLDPLSMTRLSDILALDPDDADYLKKVKEIFQTNYMPEELLTNANYNQMLHDIVFKHQKISVKNYLVAHSHNLNYFNNNNSLSHFASICQVTSGAGGEKLQSRLNFSEADNLGGFFGKHGCIVLEIDPYHPELFHIYFHTVDGSSLHFTNESSQPLQAPLTDIRTIMLRNDVLEACKTYEALLNEIQTTKDGAGLPNAKKSGAFLFFSNYVNPYMHTHAIVYWLHEIKNYFNQPVMPDYETVKFQLQQFLHKLSGELNHSFDKHPFCRDLSDALAQVDEEFKMRPATQLG